MERVRPSPDTVVGVAESDTPLGVSGAWNDECELSFLKLANKSPETDVLAVTSSWRALCVRAHALRGEREQRRQEWSGPQYL